MALKERLEMEAGNVLSEAMNANAQYGDFMSTHEAYGVLAEEVSELLSAIRENKSMSIAMEARQVSAVAMRLAEICEREFIGEAPQFGKRSGL